MAGAGYPGRPTGKRVAGLLRKEGLKRDAETQALEDVVCFVFLRWYFADFAAKHGELDIERIVTRDRPQDVAGSPRRRRESSSRCRPGSRARSRGSRGKGSSVRSDASSPKVYGDSRDTGTHMECIWDPYGR